MPLIPGKGKQTLADNIDELLNSFKSKGTLGASRPKNMKAAQKQAIAIAYSKQRESQKG